VVGIGSTTTDSVTIGTQMPLTIDNLQAAISGNNDNCYAATAYGLEVQPYDFIHPPEGGVYDPGGALGAAEEGNTMGINGDSLPYTHTFPID